MVARYAVGGPYAVKFAAPLTFPKFEDDDLNQLAILKSIKIIGEAASRISDETKAKRPDISWTEIDGMRSRFVNACFAIRLDALWQIVQDDLPPLIAQLEVLVPPEPE